VHFRCGYCDNHSGNKYFDLPDDGALDTEQGKNCFGSSGKICRESTSAAASRPCGRTFPN